jgi:transposase
VLATGTPYTDLGPGFYASHADPGRETQRLIARLQALGHKITIEPAAAAQSRTS